MITIYEVGATTGDYEDKTEWIVCSYLREEDAKAHTDAANNWAKEHGFYEGERPYKGDRPYKNPYDPKGRCDTFTGVQYEYWQSDIKPHETFAQWRKENGVAE